MTRTLELEVLDDGTALLDGEPMAGVGRDPLRTALETAAEQARVDSVSTTVRIRRGDGHVWTVAAEPDGSIRRLASAVREIPVDELKREQVGDILTDLRDGPSARQKFLKVGAWMVAGILVVLGGGASIITDGADSAPAASQADSSLADLGRPAPTGWTQSVTWQVAPVAEIAPVATGNQVVYVSTDNRVGAVDSATGTQLWLSAPLPFRPDASAVAAGSSNAAFVALRLHDTVAVLPTNSPAGTQVVPRLAEIPGAGRLVGGPGGILVETPNLSDAVVVTATGEVRHAAVPAGQTALAVSNDGSTVVVAPSQGAWSNLPLGEGSATPIPAVAPEGANGDPHAVSASAGVVVAWWATADPAVRIVAFHDASTGAVLGSGKAQPAVVDAGLPVVIAVDRSHMSAGPVLFNATTSQVVVSDGWVPSNVAGDLIYGKVGDSRAVWRGTGPVKILPTGAAVPWSIAPNGLAIVMDRQGEMTRLVAVQPR